MRRLLFPAILIITALAACTGNRRQALARADSSLSGPHPHYLTANDSSGQLMPEDNFWKIVDASRRLSGGHYQSQITALQQVLEPMDAGDIVHFDNTFTALMAGSYDWQLWGAAYVINGTCADDCFEHFREYLIAQGRDRFYATLQSPDGCASWISPEQRESWEGFRYAAAEAYRQKRGKELRTTNQAPVFTLKGQPFDSATVRTQYPMLAAKFPRHP